MRLCYPATLDSNLQHKEQLAPSHHKRFQGTQTWWNDFLWLDKALEPNCTQYYRSGGEEGEQKSRGEVLNHFISERWYTEYKAATNKEDIPMGFRASKRSKREHNEMDLDIYTHNRKELGLGSKKKRHVFRSSTKISSRRYGRELRVPRPD